jgi:hypothetical protein
VSLRVVTGKYAVQIVVKLAQSGIIIHMKMETDPVSETLYFLVFRIPDDIQSPQAQ